MVQVDRGITLGHFSQGKGARVTTLERLEALPWFSLRRAVFGVVAFPRVTSAA